MALALQQPDQYGTGSRWRPDFPAEQLLGRLGVTWEYRPSIPVNLIPTRRSLSIQNRLTERLDDALVEQYAVAMSQGSAFPALVGFAEADGSYTLAGGNHRLAAALREGLSTVDLYVIRTSDAEVRRRVTLTLNQVNGDKPSQADTLVQALAMKKETGRSYEDVAQYFMLPTDRLRRAGALERAGERLAAAGLDSRRFAQRTLQRFATVENNNVLRAVAELTTTYRLVDTEVKEVLEAVRDEGTEADQLSVVELWHEREDLRGRAGGVSESKKSSVVEPRVKRRTALTRHLRGLLKLLQEFPSRSLLGLANDDDYLKVADAARTIVTRVEALHGHG
jgi:ParB-like chromosome segregation protein Spo0J